MIAKLVSTAISESTKWGGKYIIRMKSFYFYCDCKNNLNKLLWSQIVKLFYFGNKY